MEKVKRVVEFIKNIKWKNIVEWFKSDEGILLSLLVFFPGGLYLLWKYGKNKQYIKIIATVAIGVLFLNFLVMKGQSNKNSDKYQALSVQYEELKNENSKVSHKNETLNGKVERINNELDETSTEFTKYQEKMKPY